MRPSSAGKGKDISIHAFSSCTQLVALALCFSLLAYGKGNTFNRVRYNGGSVASKVDPKEWDNKLTVTSETITLEFKDGQKVDIPAKSVTTISYGQEAHRRVGTMVALAILVAPVALFGLFHKTRLHYIGIQYSSAESKNAGILLQGDKDNYRAILVALQGVTGVPVSVGEKERGFIPVGVTTTVAKDSEDAKGGSTSAASTAPPPATGTMGTVSVATVPDSADVYVDSQFYGNGPVTLKLKPGKHSITVKKAEYKDWTREISTEAGSEAHLTANLEK